MSDISKSLLHRLYDSRIGKSMVNLGLAGLIAGISACTQPARPITGPEPTPAQTETSAPVPKPFSIEDDAEDTVVRIIQERMTNPHDFPHAGADNYYGTEDRYGSRDLITIDYLNTKKPLVFYIYGITRNKLLHGINVSSYVGPLPSDRELSRKEVTNYFQSILKWVQDNNGKVISSVSERFRDDLKVDSLSIVFEYSRIVSTEDGTTKIEFGKLPTETVLWQPVKEDMFYLGGVLLKTFPPGPEVAFSSHIEEKIKPAVIYWEREGRIIPITNNLGMWNVAWYRHQIKSLKNEIIYVHEGERSKPKPVSNYGEAMFSINRSEGIKKLDHRKILSTIVVDFK